MDYDTIIVERKDRIGLITFNRPEQMNTFTAQLARELNDALRELDEDEQIRVVIIKGNGKAFCAGIDVKEIFDKDIVEIRRWVKAMDEHNETIASMKKPVIAAVQGAAVANGCGLVAACDLAIAADDARLGTTAINVGLFCFGPAAPLVRSVGRKRSLKMLLTGDIIDAVEAERIGLVNEVVPREKLEEAVMALAEKLAKKNPVSLQIGKNAFYKMSNMTYEDSLAYLGEMFSIVCSTEDGREGINAFLEKREPHWSKESS
jgi:enoyl-CoA hydratase/carnithine racemase